MDVAALLASLESTALATRIRDSLYLFPLLESTHVLGLALVFGTIAIIDLRLLGLASTQRSFKKIASDVLKWTWAAFALTAATGALMFKSERDHRDALRPHLVRERPVDRLRVRRPGQASRRSELVRLP